jgi:hypothetical protein
VARVPDYNFLCGILTSREPSLLSAGRLEAVISARTFPDALSQLPEGRFASEVRRAPGYEGIEAGSRAEIAAVRDLLAKYSPSEALDGLLVAPLDWFNLKVAVLQTLTGRRDERVAGVEGALRFAALAAMADAGVYDGLPRRFADALRVALAAFAEAGKTAQAFELSIDRQREIAMLALARGVSPGVETRVRESADRSAAAAFARAVLAGIPWTVARHAFAGHPDASRLADLAVLAPAEWPSRLAGIGSPVIRSFLAAVAGGGDMAALQTAGRRAQAAGLRAWRLRPPSAEYAYWWIAHLVADLAALRLALVARLNGISEAEVRARIDDGLV